MDKYDSYDILKERYNDLILNYDYTLPVDSQYKIDIDHFEESDGTVFYAVAILKDVSTKLIEVSTVSRDELPKVIKGLQRLIRCLESKINTVIDEELINNGFYLEYEYDKDFLSDLKYLSHVSRVTKD